MYPPPSGQLSGEQERWKTQAGQLQGDIKKLPMKMLLAAGFATYLAKTPEDVRAERISSWSAITGRVRRYECVCLLAHCDYNKRKYMCILKINVI